MLSLDGGQFVIQNGQKGRFLISINGDIFKSLTRKQAIKVMDFLKQQIESEKK